MRMAFVATVLAWAAFEISLLVRDRVRGTGSTAADRGTRSLFVLAWLVAFLGAALSSDRIKPGSSLHFGHGHLLGGLVVMWAGIAVRVWSIVVLGRSFRTTVEVDPGQQVVDRGPYRLVRHPSYSGLLIVAVGAGIYFGNWISLALMIVLPVASTLRRIAVEEAALTQAMGQPYVEYRQRTKRLIPRIW
jgi:protein-S-isoprenylcysteine O-methyltransferase Ste14